LDEAITAYTEALKVRPGLLSAHLNRSVAYQERRERGDLVLALADADEVIKAMPDWAEAYNNRAAVLIYLSGQENLSQAEADLNQALTLKPDLISAYINRAILYFQQGLPLETWKPDLDQALALKPNHAAALNMLCWGYAVEEEPATAMPYCEQAVAIEPDPAYVDSRGLAHALLGNYEQAIADFEIFIVWLEEQSGEAYRTTLNQRRDWVEQLKSGRNPFTPEVLAELRKQ
jgi:tetratricopeptide (TPR) repeat protein